MTREVIIDVHPKNISIALLEDKRLVEYQSEKREETAAVGNIYAARVRKIMPALNSCFVDVGCERMAFLHYLDLGLQFSSALAYQNALKSGSTQKSLEQFKLKPSPDLPKDGQIGQMLKTGDEVIVQISKESISTKGPRVTGELSFAGRNLVLIPFGDKVSISSKIKSEAERARLKQLVYSIKPNNFGVIVRTVAEGKRVAELDSEMKILLSRCAEMYKRVMSVQKPPALVHEELSRVVVLLRDLFNTSFESIYVNDAAVFNEIRAYLELISSGSKNIVKLYKGGIPIFDNFEVTKQIKSAFGRTVTYKHGAYLIIEHTEALHVVDVNSGNRTKNTDGQEVNALEVNLGAADELARQLRLRDMGGIIVVDFIDMSLAEDRQKLYERMCHNMENDRARHNILPLSKFGLMQITRQRVRPAMDIVVEEACPACGGTGRVKPSLLFVDTLRDKVRALSSKFGMKRFTLQVHPYVAAYICKGVFSIKAQWKLKYGMRIKIMPNQNFSFLQYKFLDAHGAEIGLKDNSDTR